MISNFYKGTYCSKYNSPSDALIDIVFSTDEEAKKVDGLFLFEITNALGGDNLFDNKNVVIFQCRSDYTIPLNMGMTTNHFYQLYQHSHNQFISGLNQEERNNGIQETTSLHLETIDLIQDKLQSLLKYYLG